MEQVHFEQFETEIRYHFKNRHFLVEALSHSSYANEKKKCRCSNERLEFLGDVVWLVGEKEDVYQLVNQKNEKVQLAAVMERYGIEWEHLGTHEKHLSVLDYKKVSKVAVATLFLLFLLVDFLAWPQIGSSTSGIVKLLVSRQV